MNFYDDLVMQTQRNYSKYYPIYASGSTPLSADRQKPLPYSEQIQRLVQEVKDADCVVVGGALRSVRCRWRRFYYEDNDSYRKYFRPFAEEVPLQRCFCRDDAPMEDKGRVLGVSRHLPSHHPDRTCASFLFGFRRFAERQRTSSSSPPTRIPNSSNFTRRRRWQRSRGSSLPVRRLLYR